MNIYIRKLSIALLETISSELHCIELNWIGLAIYRYIVIVIVVVVFFLKMNWEGANCCDRAFEVRRRPGCRVYSSIAYFIFHIRLPNGRRPAHIVPVSKKYLIFTYLQYTYDPWPYRCRSSDGVQRYCIVLYIFYRIVSQPCQLSLGII